MRKKRGKAAKKARAALSVTEDNDLVKAPHSFVFHRGEAEISLEDVDNLYWINLRIKDWVAGKKNTMSVLGDFV